MKLTRAGVRIIVHEPNNWSKGNLFGTIVSERGQILTVKLSHKIVGNQVTSDLLKLSPHQTEGRFKALAQYYSVMVNGSLIDEDTQQEEALIYGSVTFD